MDNDEGFLKTFFKENLLCKSCTWVMSWNKLTELLTPIYRFMRYNKDNRIYPKRVPNFRVNYYRSFINSSKRKSITSFSIFRLCCSSLHQKIVDKFLNFKQNFLLNFFVKKLIRRFLLYFLVIVLDTCTNKSRQNLS